MHQKSATLALIVGVAAGGFGVLIWLLFYGDLVGYIVYHIIFNQTVYAPFIHFTFSNFFRSLVPSLSPSKEIQTLGVLCCFLSCALFILTDLSRSPKQSLSIALGHAGILLLSARGGSLFQNGTFLVASFGTLSLAMAVTVGKVSSVKSPMVAVLGTLMVGACIAGTEFASRRALSTPVSLTRAEIVRQPKYIIYHCRWTGITNTFRGVRRTQSILGSAGIVISAKLLMCRHPL